MRWARVWCYVQQQSMIDALSCLAFLALLGHCNVQTVQFGHINNNKIMPINRTEKTKHTINKQTSNSVRRRRIKSIISNLSSLSSDGDGGGGGINRQLLLSTWAAAAAVVVACSASINHQHLLLFPSSSSPKVLLFAARLDSIPFKQRKEKQQTAQM